MQFFEQEQRESVVSIIVALIIFPLNLILLAPHVVVQLWKWHVVPLGVPMIGHWQAFGLIALSVMFRTHYSHSTKASSLNQALSILGASLFMWLFGWLAS